MKLNPYQGDTGQDLQQGNEVVSIPQVLVEVGDVLPHLRREEGRKQGGRKRRGERMRRGVERERETDRKLIPHSNHPSVDSTLLTSARTMTPRLTGLVTAVARATETEHRLWLLDSVAMTMSRGDTVTQQPDACHRPDGLPLFESGTRRRVRRSHFIISFTSFEFL